MACISNFFKNCFRILDVFGRHYLFEEDDLQKFKTCFGGVLTLLISICVIVIGFIFGKEIYERETPKVTSSDDIAAIESTLIKATDIPVIISFFKEDGSALMDVDRLLQLKSSQYCYGDNLELEIKFFPYMVDCDSTKFGIHEGYVNKTVEEWKEQGHNPKCLNVNDDFSFKNKFTARSSCFLEYEVKMCDSSKEDNNCHPDLIKLTNQIYVTARTLSSYVNPRNYTHPVVYYEETISTQIGNQFLKRTYFRYSQNILESDVGWLLESKQSVNYISLKNTQQDLNPIVDGIMYWMDFESPPLRNRTVRIYIKVQELLATIGGLFNGLYIITSLLLFSYVKFEYYLQISLFVSAKDRRIQDNSSNSKLNVLPGIAKNSRKINNFVASSKSQTQAKSKTPQEVSISKIDKPQNLNELTHAKNVRLHDSPSNYNFEQMSYLSYICMFIFSLCSTRYKERLLFYSKSLNFSKRIISFNNYVQISNKMVGVEEK